MVSKAESEARTGISSGTLGSVIENGLALPVIQLLCQELGSAYGLGQLSLASLRGRLIEYQLRLG